MSIILDALKKLDRERSFRRNMTANIAVEILRPDLPRPEKRFPHYFATISLTAMAVAVITYFAIVDFLPKSLPPAPVNPPASSQQVTPAPVSREAAQEVRNEIKRESLKPSTPAEGKITVESKPDATSVDEKKVKPDIIKEKTEVPSSSIKKIPEQATTGSSTNPPSLKLSAIVWYEDPSMRFIMVNGIKATEGSFIEGVKVVEINPTKVRFLYNGQYFEISM